MEMDPLKLENDYVNPWTAVKDLSEFLNYCCPECDYRDKFEQSFSCHALQNHKNSSAYFENNKIKFRTIKIATQETENEENQNDFAQESDIDTDADWRNVKIKIENDMEMEMESISGDHVIKSETTKNKQSQKIDKFTESVHEEKKLFNCSMCDFSSGLKYNLTRHYDTVHEKKKSVPCTYCDLCFIQKSDLKRHCETVHKEEKVTEKLVFHCEICKTSYDRKHTLKRHIEQVHEGKKAKEFPCSLCHKSFSVKRNRKRHVVEFHEGKKPMPIIRSKESKKQFNLTCELCWLALSSYKEKLKHNKEKHLSKDGNKMKCCIYCDHKTKEWANLQRHIDYKHPDHGEKKHVCDCCSEKFIFNFSLTHHKRHVHQNFVCEICGASYTNLHRYKEHMNLKHNPNLAKTFVCEQCGFSAVSITKLRRHVHEKHEVERHHQCPHCPYKQHALHRLNIHIDNVHPDIEEKKFFCDHCPKSFIFQDSLKKHMDTVKIKGKYLPRVNINCDYCKEALETSFAVKMHYRLEHPNKPMLLPEHTRYNCDLCDTFYFHELHLKNHVRRVHESETIGPKLSINCDYCDEVFTASFFLKKHYKNLHPDQPIIAEGHNKCKCLKCPDFFFLEQELDVHLNLEHGVDTEQNYCKICRQPYRDVHNCSLKKQRDKNNEEKCRGKYSCSQCTRVFSAADYLKDHIKSVHENCLDYECEKCKKKFVSKIRLTSHIVQTHSSQVNCGICNKKISNPQQLKRHMVFSHNETEGAIFCVQCPKSVFFKESTYKVHMENKHDIFK